MTGKRVLALLCALLMTAALLPSVAYGAAVAGKKDDTAASDSKKSEADAVRKEYNDLQQQINDKRKEMDDLKNELNNIKSQKANTQQQKNLLDQRNAALQEEINLGNGITGKTAALEARIAELEEILLHAVIVDESEMDSDKISIGCRVVVTNLDNGKQLPEYTIVGSQEANVMERKVSEDSPFGKALMGTKAGDEITVEAPRGVIRYRVDSIER